jgi:hypothetical protein
MRKPHHAITGVRNAYFRLEPLVIHPVQIPRQMTHTIHIQMSEFPLQIVPIPRYTLFQLPQSHRQTSETEAMLLCEKVAQGRDGIRIYKSLHIPVAPAPLASSSDHEPQSRSDINRRNQRSQQKESDFTLRDERHWWSTAVLRTRNELPWGQ